MTDDIVTRLRELAVKQDAKWSDPTDAPLTMYQVAADEIERLRKLTGSLATLIMPFALLMTKEEQEMVVKAVRGE